MGKEWSSAVGGNIEFLGEQRRRPWELKYTAGKETREAKRAEKKWHKRRERQLGELKHADGEMAEREERPGSKWKDGDQELAT